MNTIYLLLIILIIIAIAGLYFVKKAEIIEEGKRGISNETLEELATTAAEEILENMTAGNMTPREISDYLG